MIHLILALIPVALEWYDDRNGDFNKARDVAGRIGAVLGLLGYDYYVHQDWIRTLVFLGLILGTFFMFFDYGLNFILWRRGIVEPYRWMTPTMIVFEAQPSKDSWFDNIPLWKNMYWSIKFIVRLVFYITTVVLWFVFRNG